MKITNIEMLQAAIGVIGALFCMMTLFFLSAHRIKRETKYLMLMFAICTALFAMDTCVYIFRGNTDDFSIFMTRLSSGMIFLLNVLIMLVFIFYFYCIVESHKIKISIYYGIISVIPLAMAVVTVIVNEYNHWMYYYDVDNYYHRNFGWYVYSALISMGIFIMFIITLSIRKNVDKSFFEALLLYEASPFIAIIIQIYFYGISIINIGITISLTLLLLYYLKQEAEDKKRLGYSAETERNLFATISMLGIMVVCMGASIITCVACIQKISSDNSKKDSINITQLVKSELENNFLPYFTLSEMITSDYEVREILENNSSDNAKDYEAYMSEFLTNIKDEFGYQMVFVVSDKSGAYYTYDGITKFVDVKKDSHDIWYENFRKSNELYLLDVDTDQANGDNLTVFVNREIRNKDGEFLGIGGVGIDMETFQSILKKYEDEYNIKINLINENGLIQIDSDSNIIENKNLESDYLSDIPWGEFYYEKSTDIARISCYVDLLKWYLVIEDMQINKISVQKIVMPCIIIFIVGLLIMGIAFAIITRRERISFEKLIERTRISLTDELTGVYNRRAYEEYRSKLTDEKMHNNFVLIMIDVNGLKGVNDGIGHSAGDELLSGVTECMKEVFISLGRIFRIGGDEYIVALECTKKEAETAIAAFEIAISSWSGKEVLEASVSLGYVVGNENKNMSIDEMEEAADKLMYEEKQKYYIKTGKVRRK